MNLLHIVWLFKVMLFFIFFLDIGHTLNIRSEYKTDTYLSYRKCKFKFGNTRNLRFAIDSPELLWFMECLLLYNVLGPLIINVYTVCCG